MLRWNEKLLTCVLGSYYIRFTYSKMFGYLSRLLMFGDYGRATAPVMCDGLYHLIQVGDSGD